VGEYVGTQLYVLSFCCLSGGNVNVCGVVNDDGVVQSIMSTIGLTQGKYQGTIICPICNLVPNKKLSFIIVDNNMSELTVEQVSNCYGSQLCSTCVPGVDPCNIVFSSQGNLIGELVFEISYSGDDCLGFHDGNLTLIRQ